jgi:hypothetical protein
MRDIKGERLSLVREYLQRKGVDPDLAPALLEELRRTRLSLLPRLIEIIFAGIGVYCVSRHIFRFFLGW